MAKESFLRQLGKYKYLRGNDLRMLLICFGREVHPKDVAMELGWKKQNVSNTARRLEEVGLLTITEYPVSYKTNEQWRCPDVPGQLEFKESDK